MHQCVPFCQIKAITVLSKASCLNEACLCLGVTAWQQKWGGILCWQCPMSWFQKLAERCSPQRAPKSEIEFLGVLQQSLKPLTFRTYIIYWGRGRYFQWHLVAFSKEWTLGSGRFFLPGPNCPSLYWSSEHSAHLFSELLCHQASERSQV